MGKPYFLKHKQYKDVCWRILAQYGAETYVKFKFEWWNLAFVQSYPMGIVQYTDIPYDDFSNWLYTTDVVSCLRDANWKELSHEKPTV